MEQSADPQQSPNRTVWLILSYTWIVACCVFLPAIPLVVEREDEFAKWHAKHGIVLALVWFFLSVVLLGIANLFGLFWDAGKSLFYILWGFVGVAFLVLNIISMMKAFEGQRWTVKPLEGFLKKLN